MFNKNKISEDDVRKATILEINEINKIIDFAQRDLFDLEDEFSVNNLILKGENSLVYNDSQNNEYDIKTISNYEPLLVASQPIYISADEIFEECKIKVNDIAFDLLHQVKSIKSISSQIERNNYDIARLINQQNNIFNTINELLTSNNSVHLKKANEIYDLLDDSLGNIKREFQEYKNKELISQFNDELLLIFAKLSGFNVTHKMDHDDMVEILKSVDPTKIMKMTEVLELEEEKDALLSTTVTYLND